MARKDIIRQDGTLNYDAIGGFKERMDGHDVTLGMKANQSDLNAATASLADMANKVYAGEPNGTDDTTHLQAVINSLVGNNGTLILKSGKTYNVTTLTVTGKLKIDGNWATLNSISPDNTAPMIQNNSGVKLTIKEVAFNGKNVAIQNTLIGNASGVGTRTYVDNCSFQGLTRVSNGITLRQNDFVKISNCIFYNYDTSIRIESDYSVNERDNTQIFFDNINFGWCNLAVYMRQCDKAELKGCDIQICGSGFYLAQDNKRVRFIDCHVEHWGNSTYTGSINFGYAYYIPPALTQNDITYENCTAFLGDSGALAGFYKGYNDVAWTDATYRNCYADTNASLTNYRSFNVAGTYKIEGRWDYLDNQVSIYSANSRFNDSIIKPYGNVNSASENLLPFSRISSPEQFSTSGTGTLTISADTDGNLYNAKNIAITTSSQYENYVLLTLKRGWYTLLFNGYSVTGTPYMYVEQHASPFSEKVRAQMKAGRPNQIYRMVFFVPTTESYRVGFWANTNASFILNRWELHFGFDYEYSDDPFLYKMVNQPTQGYWLKGERVRNNNITELGSVGSKYVIQEWECITAGSPGTWLQKRFLTGN